MVALVYYVIAPHKVFVSLSSTVGTLPLLKHFVTVCHQHTLMKEESASDKAGGEPCIPSLIWRINGQLIPLAGLPHDTNNVTRTGWQLQS